MLAELSRPHIQFFNQQFLSIEHTGYVFTREKERDKEWEKDRRERERVGKKEKSLKSRLM